jgi:hypothetical protein
MNNELEMIWKKALGICLVELRETRKNFSQDSRSGRAPGRDLKPKLPEHEAGVLTT